MVSRVRECRRELEAYIETTAAGDVTASEAQLNAVFCVWNGSRTRGDKSEEGDKGSWSELHDCGRKSGDEIGSVDMLSWEAGG